MSPLRTPHGTSHEPPAALPPALATWWEREGTLLRLRLNRPPRNLIDRETGDAILAALDHAAEAGKALAVLIDHEGPHFSYGASIQEHLPEHCADMLHRFHALIRRMTGFPLPILVAVRGYCLGGGLELASAGHLLFCAPDARLGQPEIRLSVFAPAASCLLPERIGQARADDMLLSGRQIDSREAVAIGLATALAETPAEAALDWFETHLAGHSPVGLRHATLAAREGFARRIDRRLKRIETLYLDQLMQHHDPVEGLHAFLEKRSPRWTGA